MYDKIQYKKKKNKIKNKIKKKKKMALTTRGGHHPIY